MDLFELHRTFLYADQVSGGNRARPNVCHFQEPDEVLALTGFTESGGSSRPTHGRELEIIGLPSDVPKLLQQCQATVANDRTSAGETIETDVRTYPDLKHRRAVGWDGQNFFAYATNWEIVHSKLVADRQGDMVNFTPVLDKSGLVIGHYAKGVSTRELWVDDDGQLYYYKDFYSELHGFNPRGSRRFAGAEVYLTSDERIMAWTESARQLGPEDLAKLTNTRIPSDSAADIMVDIEGNVVSIHMYDPLWRPHSAPTPAVLLMFLLDALTGLPEGCEPGIDGIDFECHPHQGGARIFLYVMTLMWDMMAVGPSPAAVGRLIYPTSKMLKNTAATVAKQGVKGVVNGARGGVKTITTLALKGARNGRVVVAVGAGKKVPGPSVKAGDLVSLPRNRGASRELTGAAMETFLRDTLRQRPYLARLRVAARLDGQALIDELMKIVKEWQTSTGKLYLEVPEGIVRRVGSQGAGGWALDSVSGKEVLIIEQQAAARPRELLREVVHELTYDAVREADGVPALINNQLPAPARYANSLLENIVTGRTPENTWDFLRRLQ